ncbi:MAG: transposase [bacterium]|nr:transposase [bacterium]
MSTAYDYTENKLFQLFLLMLGKMVHGDLVRQIEYLKVENRILRSKLGLHVRTTYQEKLKLIRYGLRLGGKIKNLISIVKYSTFRRWVNLLENGTLQVRRLGRPRTTKKEIVQLIIRMAKENLDWGYGRIMGELKKLGIYRHRNTIKSVMRENGLEPAPKRYEDSWDAYIKRSFETLWACDFFSKTIWTPFGKKVIFVLFFINIRTRKVHIAGVTDHPKKLWMVNRAKYMEQFFENDDTTKLLIRDGDKKYPKLFDEIFKTHKTKVKVLPYRSPNLNPYSEAWVRTIKKECLEKFFIFGNVHLEYLVREFTTYYNTHRPHSGLDNLTIRESTGSVKCESRLGGIVKHYYRE